MIRVDQDFYYSCDESQCREAQEQMEKARESPERALEVVGDVKGYLSAISDKVKAIRQLREKEKKEQLESRMILDQLDSL